VHNIGSCQQFVGLVSFLLHPVGAVIEWERCLVAFSILDGTWQIWPVLWFQRCNVTIFCELFHNIFYHSKIDMVFCIVPF